MQYLKLTLGMRLIESSWMESSWNEYCLAEFPVHLGPLRVPACQGAYTRAPLSYLAILPVSDESYLRLEGVLASAVMLICPTAA